METFVGFIGAFGFNFAPRNWGLCQGALIAINDNPTLFSLVSDFYGGDGRTTFGVPDLRGRTAIGYGAGPGLPNYNIGWKPGDEQIALTVSQMPTHNHIAQVSPGSCSVSAYLEASTVNGDHDVPQSGDYLATSFKGRGDLNKNYISAANAGTTVPLGGLEVNCSGGSPASVSILNAGAGNPFSIMQPSLVINFCIALQGVYPPRN